MPREDRVGTDGAGRRGDALGASRGRERRDWHGRVRPPALGTRAQTNLDFALGVGVFVTVIIFIFAFAPGILSPFTTGMQEETVAADRIADQLARSMLGSPEHPLRLDRRCVVAFYTGSPPVVPASGPVAGSKRDCGYLSDRSAISGYPVRERVGVMPRTLVNVTMEADLNDDGAQTAVCWDSGAEKLQEKGTGNCDNDGDGTVDDTLFIAGRLEPNNNDVITATRTVTVEGSRITMYVHVA